MSWFSSLREGIARVSVGGVLLSGRKECAEMATKFGVKRKNGEGGIVVLTG